jgi:G:T/U-mismatch repair DNA glycosylase
MLKEICEPNSKALFVGAAADEISDKLGFYHVDPKDRFWELMEVGGITPKRIITPSERKALMEGHAQGSIPDPIRVMFIQKKTSQLTQLGIGLTDVNRRVIATSDKDRTARPSEEDVQQFMEKAARLNAKAVAFVMRPELFVELFKGSYPGVTDVLGLQSFRIGNAAVWLLGSTTARLREDALAQQEDTFFALGERILVVS